MTQHRGLRITLEWSYDELEDMLREARLPVTKKNITGIRKFLRTQFHVDVLSNDDNFYDSMRYALGYEDTEDEDE